MRITTARVHGLREREYRGAYLNGTPVALRPSDVALEQTSGKPVYGTNLVHIHVPGKHYTVGGEETARSCKHREIVFDFTVNGATYTGYITIFPDRGFAIQLDSHGEDDPVNTEISNALFGT